MYNFKQRKGMVNKYLEYFGDCQKNIDSDFLATAYPHVSKAEREGYYKDYLYVATLGGVTEIDLNNIKAFIILFKKMMKVLNKIDKRMNRYWQDDERENEENIDIEGDVCVAVNKSMEKADEICEAIISTALVDYKEADREDPDADYDPTEFADPPTEEELQKQKEADDLEKEADDLNRKVLVMQAQVKSKDEAETKKVAFFIVALIAFFIIFAL